MERRAQQDRQYWAQHIVKQQASGLSVREYCQRESLQAHHFYYWRRRAAATEPIDSYEPERIQRSKMPTG